MNILKDNPQFAEKFPTMAALCAKEHELEAYLDWKVNERVNLAVDEALKFSLSKHAWTEIRRQIKDGVSLSVGVTTHEVPDGM